MLWVAVGQAPGLFLYAYLGTLGQLGLNLVRGKSHPLAIEYLIWGGGLLSSIVVLMLIGRVALRLLRKAEDAARAEALSKSSSNCHEDDISKILSLKEL